MKALRFISLFLCVCFLFAALVSCSEETAKNAAEEYVRRQVMSIDHLTSKVIYNKNSVQFVVVQCYAGQFEASYCVCCRQSNVVLAIGPDEVDRDYKSDIEMIKTVFGVE